MLVMIISSVCIFVFSVGYMADDKNFTRFFAYLSFSLEQCLVWSLRTVCFYFSCSGNWSACFRLLIGFWIERPAAAEAAKKAFITTRIGDMDFFWDALAANHSGTLRFMIGEMVTLRPRVGNLGASATFIALLIFCGVAGKSGNSRCTFGYRTRWKVRLQLAR
jgi:NADH-quinone oxidoreductase subunit L